MLLGNFFGNISYFEQHPLAFKLVLPYWEDFRMFPEHTNIAVFLGRFPNTSEDRLNEEITFTVAFTFKAIAFGKET